MKQTKSKLILIEVLVFVVFFGLVATVQSWETVGQDRGTTAVSNSSAYIITLSSPPLVTHQLQTAGADKVSPSSLRTLERIVPSILLQFSASPFIAVIMVVHNRS